MTIGLAFWVLMLIWFAFGIAFNMNPSTFGGYGIFGHAAFIFILFGLLGWQVFGAALRKSS